MSYLVVDEHDNQISAGHPSREAANASRLRWENENPGRQAFVEGAIGGRLVWSSNPALIDPRTGPKDNR